MEKEILEALELFGTRNAANIELASTILDGNAPLKKAVLEYVQNTFGWLERKGRTYDEDEEYYSFAGYGSPFDWLLQDRYTFSHCATFGKLPQWIKEIEIYGMNYLPALPTELEYLVLDESETEHLTNLPPNLKYLRVADCEQLLSIGNLPETLQVLEVWQCRKLEYLPRLPESLTNLRCEYNGLVALPILPRGLVQCEAKGNNIQSIESLPATLPPKLRTLDLTYNPISSQNKNKYCSLHKAIKYEIITECRTKITL